MIPIISLSFPAASITLKHIVFLSTNMRSFLLILEPLTFNVIIPDIISIEPFSTSHKASALLCIPVIVLFDVLVIKSVHIVPLSRLIVMFD